MQPGDSLQLPFEERRILSVTGLNREARRIVEENHHGRLSLVPTDQGATFDVILPA